MEKEIFDLLHNDIISSIMPKVFYVDKHNNVENFNIEKTPLNGEIISISDNYNTRFYRNTLYFESVNPNPSIAFLDYIKNLFEFLAVGKNTLYYNLLDDIKKIHITNETVDSLFLNLLVKYFPNIESLTFNNCHIKKDCFFDKSKKLVFNNCIIEDTKIFNNTQANLEFRDSTINNISIGNIFSSEIDFNNTKIDFKSLFLKVNFLDLIKLDITNRFLDDVFTFLPFSAKKLEELRIYGKISSLDFLIKMPNILRCSIESTSDICGNFFSEIANKKEALRLRNKKEYREFTKMAGIDVDTTLASLEVERILRLNHFYKMLKLNAPSKDKLEGYYKAFYDTLIYYENTENLELKDNFLYYFFTPLNKRGYYKALKFMYNNRLVPIVFAGYKPSKRVLVKKSKEVTKKEVIDYYLSMLEEALEFRKDGATFEEIATIYQDMSEKSITEEMLNMTDPHLIGEFDVYKRNETRKQELKRKNELYYQELLKLIKDNYPKFNIEEKKYLYFTLQDEAIYKYYSLSDFLIKNIKWVNMEEEINRKTNGRYKTLKNYLHLTFLQALISEGLKGEYTRVLKR